jgi:hypothetical protein
METLAGTILGTISLLKAESTTNRCVAGSTLSQFRVTSLTLNARLKMTLPPKKSTPLTLVWTSTRRTSFGDF